MSSQYHIRCNYDDSKSSITCSSNSTSSTLSRSSLESIHSQTSDSTSSQKLSSNQSRGRSVSFSSTLEVCTIPTREELQHLHCEMYWNIEDVQLFKDEAYSEIFIFAEKNQCTLKESLNKLYSH